MGQELGRKRTIERDEVVEAALRVIRREGTTGLSIDAVASEAGICKASVLYDFKTKKALIHAIVGHEIQAHQKRLQECGDSLPCDEDREIVAMITSARRSFSDEDRAAIIGLCASVLQDVELRDMVRAYYRQLMDGTTGTASDPRNARLALLAVEGMMSLERFNLHCWSARERQTMLDDIMSLARPEQRARRE